MCNGEYLTCCVTTLTQVLDLLFPPPLTAEYTQRQPQTFTFMVHDSVALDHEYVVREGFETVLHTALCL